MEAEMLSWFIKWWINQMSWYFSYQRRPMVWCKTTFYTSICAVQAYDGAIKAGKHRVGLGGDSSVMPVVPEEF